jgi:hypothetical protein
MRVSPRPATDGGPVLTHKCRAYSTEVRGTNATHPPKRFRLGGAGDILTAMAESQPTGRPPWWRRNWLALTVLGLVVLLAYAVLAATVLPP